jgi:pyridoxal phosphate enzyme (YggS family)
MTDCIQARVDAIRERMKAACLRSGRDPDSVRLVAVSKTYPPDRVAAAVEAGCQCFGENRVYEALPKIEACPGHLEWHFIGHLQRNKVQHVVPAFALIHAVDSLRLLERIETVATEMGLQSSVLLEVNVSGEASKYGLSPDAVPGVLTAANAMSHVDVQGLMTMAPYSQDPESARPVFRQLREWRNQWADATDFVLPELSMGMSNDFEVAIEEGATMVRVGSSIFGKREQPLVNGGQA